MTKLLWFHKLPKIFKPDDIVARKDCPICGSTISKQVSQLPPQWQDASWRRCFCGALYQSPMPSMDAMVRFYESDYREEVSDTYPDPKDLMAQSARSERQIQAFGEPRPPAPKRVLDIGCANGALLEKFRLHFGSEVVGMEFVQKDHPLLEAKNIPYFTKIEDVPGKFDLVCMSHVLEHIAEPVEYLNMLREEKANERGWLLLECPSANAPSAYSKFHTVVFPDEVFIRTVVLGGWIPKHIFKPNQGINIIVGALP